MHEDDVRIIIHGEKDFVEFYWLTKSNSPMKNISFLSLKLEFKNVIQSNTSQKSK